MSVNWLIFASPTLISSLYTIAKFSYLPGKYKAEQLPKGINVFCIIIIIFV